MANKVLNLGSKTQEQFMGVLLPHCPESNSCSSAHIILDARFEIHDQFNPLYTFSTWEARETMTKRVILAILLLSDLNHEGNSFDVNQYDHFVALTVKRFELLINLQKQH